MLLLQMEGVAVRRIWIRDRALRSASVDISPLRSLCGLRQGDREPSNLPSCLGTGRGGSGPDVPGKLWESRSSGDLLSNSATDLL